MISRRYQVIQDQERKRKQEEEEEEEENKLKAMIQEEEEKEENEVAQALLMLSEQNPWKITKKLTNSDLSEQQCRLLVRTALVVEHVLPHMDAQSYAEIRSNEGLRVRVRDLDTDGEFGLTLKGWSSSRSYVLVGGWRSEFVQRRALKLGDEIGMFWSVTERKFVFSVLQRAAA